MRPKFPDSYKDFLSANLKRVCAAKRRKLERARDREERLRLLRQDEEIVEIVIEEGEDM